MSRGISIYPTHTNNKYIPIIIEILESAGFTVIPIEDEFKKIKQIDTVIFNWYETLPEKRKVYQFIKRMAHILFLKMLGKEVCCTIHNKHPHEGKSRYSDIIVKTLLRLSTHIFILCDETNFVIQEYIPFENVKNKLIKVPLPSYAGVYGRASSYYPEGNNTLKCLYFGKIKAYKNTKMLVEVFEELSNSYDVSLKICGNCTVPEEIQMLEETRNECDKIAFDFRYIPDDEIVDMMKDYDILVLPYNTESSLNSSAAILAYSYKRTTISPMLGTLKEYGDADFFYAYTYQDDYEHKEKLRETILQVYQDFKEEPQILMKKGLEAYETVETLNSRDKCKNIFEAVWGVQS